MKIKDNKKRKIDNSLLVNCPYCHQKTKIEKDNLNCKCNNCELSFEIDDSGKVK